ncbi:MAG: hypothetical protein KAT62_08655 [Desulfuromonadales bacterium]|nr:hypothetical protein [Desulfuromonadales bacterium]
MLTPNVVILNQVTHYLVKHPKNDCEIRRLVVASGTCNGVPFEATAINDPDFSTALDLFRADGGQFSKLEFQSVQRRIKMAKPMETFDLRGDSEAKGYEYFFGQMREKYYGKKVYLTVPFNRKDEAKNLGAEWDSAVKKWFCFSSSPDLRRIEEYFCRDEP